MPTTRTIGRTAAAAAAALMLTAAVPAMAQLATPDLRLGDAGVANTPVGLHQQARTMYQDTVLSEGMNTGVTRTAHTNFGTPPATARQPNAGATANAAALHKRAERAYGQLTSTSSNAKSAKHG